MDRTVVVLDIGSSKISVLAGTRGVNDTICIKAFDETGYSGFQDGEFFEPEKVALAIKKSILSVQRLTRVLPRTVWVGVPGEFSTSVCRDAGIAFRSRRKVTELDISDLYDGADVFRGNRDYTVTDRTAVCFTLDDSLKTLRPVGETCSKISARLCFALAEKKFTAFVSKILTGLGVEEVKFVSALLAEGRYLYDEESREVNQVLVDAGFITTSVAVFRGDGMVVTKTFPMGGGHITADLCECLHMSYEDADLLKGKVSLNLEVAEDEKYDLGNGKTQLCTIVHQIIFDRLDMFAKLIKRCLSEAGLENERNISLTGGGLAYLKGARGYLSRQLATDIEVLSPRLPAVGKPEMSSVYAVCDLALSRERRRSFWSRIFH